MGFNYDKSIFGDKAESVEKIINDAIKYGSKVKAEELETNFLDRETKLKESIEGLTKKVIDAEIKDLDEGSKKIVQKLLKTESLDDIRKEMPHLFKASTFSVDDALNTQTGVLTAEEKQVLAKEQSGKLLTQDEILTYHTAILKTTEK